MNVCMRTIINNHIALLREFKMLNYSDSDDRALIHLIILFYLSLIVKWGSAISMIILITKSL